MRITKNRPECRYSHRLPMPSRFATTKTFTRSTDMGENVAHASQLPPPQLSDQRSWHADGANAIQGERHRTATGPLPLPLKRCGGNRGAFRGGWYAPVTPEGTVFGFSSHRPHRPAGEGFLSDFFDCLGFLSLASESVMYAAEPEEFGATTSPPLHVAEGAIQCLVDGGNLSGGHWDQAVPAGGGPLLHDSSTCLLWCAVGLGALVRGCPLTHVEGYVDLAQVSLTHCFDGITLDSARAYLAMAVLHDFLGNQTKSHGYLESATSIVRVLPPERLPTGIHDVLRYVGKSWVFESGAASQEEIADFLEDAVPIWKLRGSFMEQDVCSLILAVDMHVDHALFDERRTSNVGLAEEQHRSSQGSVGTVSNALFVQEILVGMHKEATPVGAFSELFQDKPGARGALILRESRIFDGLPQRSRCVNIFVSESGCDAALPGFVSP
ncbi:unnamed protein product [Pylaiella littoralis]